MSPKLKAAIGANLCASWFALICTHHVDIRLPLMLVFGIAGTASSIVLEACAAKYGRHQVVRFTQRAVVVGVWVVLLGAVCGIAFASEVAITTIFAAWFAVLISVAFFGIVDHPAE